MHERKTVLAIVVTVVITLLSFGTVGANIPSPPVNQTLGFYDTIFNDLEEADCRVCHDDPGISGPTSNVDRHHLLYGQPLREGVCSVNSNACLSDANCNPGICSSSGALCAIDTDCPDAGLGETCGEVCIGETVAPILDGNGDDVDDTNYGCLNCHEYIDVGGVITFNVERNCLQCHIQIPGEGSVHHLTPTAQGTDSPLGDPDVGDCTPCHGSLVDDIGDSHVIPTYSPSLVTPKPSGGEAPPLKGSIGAGGCDYCHDSGNNDTPPVQVYTNSETHHSTGVFISETGVVNEDTCSWCHNVSLPDELRIRVCEGCHGYESLHNIQVDSDGDCCVDPGGEVAGYGHIGADDPTGDSDCWGCHGFTTASAPGLGPVVPFISGADVLTIPAGTDVAVTLSGSAFTNNIGAFEWRSSVSLTAEDGSLTILTPDTMDACSLTVTIPATTVPGNYEVRAVKNDTTSNPIVISITPPAVISSIDCNEQSKTLTITGSGFSEKPEGTEATINVTENGTPLNIISWTDTEIQASGATCGGVITVNTLYNSSSTSTCGCEGDFDRDKDVDGTDASDFKLDFGRSTFSNPCESDNPCNGDFDCDGDADGTDARIFKEDFGRSSFSDPCPACVVENWCNY
jgi:hypothetical protein